MGLAARLALAATSGILFGLAAPPSSLYFLAWIALAPLVVTLRAGAIDAKRAAALGAVGGVGVGLVGFPWIAELLERFAAFPWPLAALGLLIFSIWMTVPYAVWAVGVILTPRHGFSAYVWPILSFSVGIYAWPVLFPYTPMIGLATEPRWIQAAEIGGVPFVEAPAIACSLLLANAVLASRARTRAIYLSVALLIPIVSFGLGSARMAAVDAEARGRPTLVVGLVQPNTPADLRSPEESLRRVRAASERAQAEGAELVVWPEAGPYPYALPHDLERDIDDPKYAVMHTHGTPTLFGAVTFADDVPYPFNSLFALDRTRQVIGRHDKVVLVPFGERIPFVDPEWAKAQIPALAQLTPGAGATRIEVDVRPDLTIGVGPLICYEDILARFTQQSARLPGGADLFVNATIDAWYGLTEPWEHLALAQFRSVEHRIPMVRAVSTGVTSIIDHNGRLQATLDPTPVTPTTLASFPEQVLVERVVLARNTQERPTIFGRIGWTWPYLSGISCALALLLRAARKRRGRRA